MDYNQLSASVNAASAAIAQAGQAYAMVDSSHKDRKFAREMYDRQRQDALADREHAENWALMTSDPAWLRERMQAAGYEFNPNGQAPAVNTDVSQARASTPLEAHAQPANWGGIAQAGAEAYFRTLQGMQQIDVMKKQMTLMEAQKGETYAMTNQIITQSFGMNIENMIKARTQNMSVEAKQLEVKNLQASIDKLNQQVAELKINNRVTNEYANGYTEYWGEQRKAIKLDNVRKMYDNKMAEIQAEIANTYGASNAQAYNEALWKSTEELALKLKGMRYFNNYDYLNLQGAFLKSNIDHLNAMARGSNASAQHQENINKAVVMGEDGKTMNATTAATEAAAEKAIGDAQQSSYYSSQFIMGIGTGLQILQGITGGIGSVGGFMNGYQRNQLIKQANGFNQQMDLYNAAMRANQTGRPNDNFYYE